MKNKYLSRINGQ